jgi:pimeloyl-ACP methyl ester carboxylesterase
MLHTTRVAAWIVVAMCLSPLTVQADLIFLKDGHVLQGTVRREFTAEFDAKTRDITLIPKGYFLLDDGPRRIVFSQSQVRIVEKTPPATEDRVIRRPQRLIVNPRPLPPVLEVVETGPWDVKTWERNFFFRAPDNARIGLKQGVVTLTPYYIHTAATTKFNWTASYLTREWDMETILSLLRTHPELVGKPSEEPAARFARHLRICDFLAQAGWVQRAEQELAALRKEFPEQKERLDNAQNLLNQLRSREEWEQIKNWFQAGRYQAVRQRLESFSRSNLPDRIQADVRAMKERLASMTEQLASAERALALQMEEVSTPIGRSLASAANVIRNELHPSTIDRLDAFLGQVAEADRRKARGQKPERTPEQLLALAVSGWLLGSPSAEIRPEYAINLWKTRQLVLASQVESRPSARQKLLDDYLKDVTPRLDIDEIAQLIDKLPPPEPAVHQSEEISTVNVGEGRSRSSYLLKLPPEYTHNRQYPVLIVLHNTGETANAMLARWQEQAAEHGYILIAPQWGSPVVDEYDFDERYHFMVLDALRDLKRRYQIDCDRVFLTGLGEGGKMAFDVGLSHPDLFAGVIPMGAGPSKYSRAYWRNAQNLPLYVINGTRAGESQKQLREQFLQWTVRGYPALWVEYKGRGTEFFTAELPTVFDWMRHQKRAFPLRRLGSDGGGGQFGNEYCTLRETDNRFYWLSSSSIHPRSTVPADRWTIHTQPATMTATINPDTNEISVMTQGLNQLTIWLGRNAAGQYQIDFDRPVNIRMGAFKMLAINRKVTPSLQVLLEDLYQRGDRKQLFLARLDFNLR